MKKILLTGATGFVGRELYSALPHRECEVIAAVREKKEVGSSIVVGNIDQSTEWLAALSGIDVVIHCVARVHVMNDNVEGPLDAFRKVNTSGTLNLARQAAESSVKRFIFISSVKVNGESTNSGDAFTAFDKRLPEDAYGQSKSEAEEQLQELAEKTGMEVVIIRPPLIYGPGVKANFASLMKLVSKGLLLPLGRIRNKRSLVSIDNLVDLIVICIDHPRAANQVFLVSDDHDVSTTELLNTMAGAAGKRPRLIPIPSTLLKVSLSLIGKKAVADRLLGNLHVDITHTKETLGWKPPISFEEGIARCFKKVGK